MVEQQARLRLPYGRTSTTSMTAIDVASESSPIRQRLLWPWAAFWLLMFAVAVQQSLWSGRLQFWRPLVEIGSAALVATGIAAIQRRRARQLDRLLGRPLHWFFRLWTWVPVQFPTYVVAMYGLRIGVYALAGKRYQHGPWAEVIAYEATNFFLFYALFSGIHFGLCSYRAWADERLAAERSVSLARQMQLSQLTHQLQPHFLFNALNTISSLIRSDPDTADSLLTRLATLLRATTDASLRVEQSLEEELALLRAYAAIMTQRFADRASISWDIEPQAQSCRVPTLGLQPLLENCFRHSVERRSAATHIVVRATCRMGRLQIEIEDDGDLHTLPDRRGVGLGNLGLRLQSLYGSQARLELKLRAGGGLLVEVSLPCAH